MQSGLLRRDEFELHSCETDLLLTVTVSSASGELAKRGLACDPRARVTRAGRPQVGGSSPAVGVDEECIW
ncbi:unnamed protein product [Protopolystoma xenopodis]|uniref:Uncharacterized protein n=1 Tax=Protopolystoma xenopodis TaxID=117903 RepID=A0A3S5AM86_9PLAT|nr:unnamed protein product [Protopolystoma xenopodis]